MAWPRPPSSETAWSEAQRNKRINRIGSLLFFIPLLTCLVLFFSFDVYYHNAPWEIAYRQRGVEVLRAQVEALPPYNTDRLAQVLANQENLSVLGNYSRNEPCEPVFAYYRQIAPEHGWTYARTDQPADYYAGVFEGYRAELELDCDASEFGYGILVIETLPLCFWSCPAQGIKPSWPDG
jgi:hypothetical protein